MAVEVDVREYIFLKEESTHTEPAINPSVQSFSETLLDSTDEDEYDASEHISESSQAPLNVFVHNPLHDLESLNWAGINMIADRRIISVGSGKKRPRAYNHPMLNEQHEWARKLFYHSMERYRFLTVPHYFSDFIKTLDPRVQPLGRLLRRIFRKLVDRYKLAEKDVESIDFNVARDLYALFKPTKANGINLQDFEDIRIAKIDYAALDEERAKRRRLS